MSTRHTSRLLALTISPRFHNNWVVRPLPSHRCTFRPQNFWVLVILNVLTDGLIMTIPVPILWQLRVSKMRKVGVSLLLCSGVFVISTAVVRAAFTIAGAPSVITINRWGCKYLWESPALPHSFFSSVPAFLRPRANATTSSRNSRGDARRQRTSPNTTLFEGLLGARALPTGKTTRPGTRRRTLWRQPR